MKENPNALGEYLKCARRQWPFMFKAMERDKNTLEIIKNELRSNGKNLPALISEHGYQNHYFNRRDISRFCFFHGIDHPSGKDINPLPSCRTSRLEKHYKREIQRLFEKALNWAKLEHLQNPLVGYLDQLFKIHTYIFRTFVETAKQNDVSDNWPDLQVEWTKRFDDCKRFLPVNSLEYFEVRKEVETTPRRGRKEKSPEKIKKDKAAFDAWKSLDHTKAIAEKLGYKSVSDWSRAVDRHRKHQNANKRRPDRPEINGN